MSKPIQITLHEAAELINASAAVILPEEEGRPVLYLEVDEEDELLFTAQWAGDSSEIWEVECFAADNETVQFFPETSVLIFNYRESSGEFSPLTITLLQVGHDRKSHE